MANILIVEDEKNMQNIISTYIQRGGHTCFRADDGVDALMLLKNNPMDLMILDIMMPHLDGFSVCRMAREMSSLPIIFLTAKEDEEDKLKGYEYGADDYMTKPFSPKILVARVEAILRRTNQSTENEVLEYGEIIINKAAHVVTINGKNIDLSFKEFELLTYFMENKGIALSREKILNSVWNYDYFGDARTIDTHVKKLRSKLGEKGDLIKTVWGMGYKFEV